MWKVTAEPQRFDDAVDWFANKTPVTRDLAHQVNEYCDRRAFTIAGVAQLDVVQQAHASLVKAIEQGTPFEDWKKSVEADLTKAWGRKDGHRIETIFRNATQGSYNAGRWRQMTSPDVQLFRPYGMFDGVVDERRSAFCKAWDGVILPLQEFAARGAVPQCHHRCRSGIRNMRESEARRRMGKEAPTDVQATPGFGQPPTESEWHPDPTKYDPTLFAEYGRKRDQLKTSAKPKRLKET